MNAKQSMHALHFLVLTKRKTKKGKDQDMYLGFSVKQGKQNHITGLKTDLY